MARSGSARGLGWIYAEGVPSSWQARFFPRRSAQPVMGARRLRPAAIARLMQHGRRSPKARAMTQERPA